MVFTVIIIEVILKKHEFSQSGRCRQVPVYVLFCNIKIGGVFVIDRQKLLDKLIVMAVHMAVMVAQRNKFEIGKDVQ